MNGEGLSQTLYPKILLCKWKSTSQFKTVKSKQVREQELNSGYETADESWNMKLERQAMTFTTIGFDWQIIESY